MRRAVSIVLVLAFLISGCAVVKTDDQKIRDQINRFITAYNSGDVDGITETLDSQSRQIVRSSLSIADNLIGSITGVDLSVKDVFSLCINFSEDFDRLSVSSFDDIQIDASSAVAYVSVVGSISDSESTQNAVFKMVKENDDWFIRDFSNIGGI